MRRIQTRNRGDTSAGFTEHCPRQDGQPFRRQGEPGNKPTRTLCRVRSQAGADHWFPSATFQIDPDFNGIRGHIGLREYLVCCGPAATGKRNFPDSGRPWTWPAWWDCRKWPYSVAIGISEPRLGRRYRRQTSYRYKDPLAYRYIIEAYKNPFALVRESRLVEAQHRWERRVVESAFSEIYDAGLILRDYVGSASRVSSLSSVCGTGRSSTKKSSACW